MFRFLFLIVVFVLAGSAWAEEPKVYKWVDEQGVVHFTEQPPEGRKCREMELQQPFTSEQIEEAQRRDSEEEAGIEIGNGNGEEETSAQRRRRRRGRRRRRR